MSIGTGVEIGPCRFRRDRHAHGIAGRLHSLRIGTGRLDRAADAAEQVNLPTQRQAAILRPLRLILGEGAARALHSVAIADPAIDVGGRQASCLGLAQRGAGPGEIGGGDAQVGVGGQRLRHQRIERRIIIEFPPLVRQRRGRIEGIGLRHESATGGGL